jgi:hypothetical protein
MNRAEFQRFVINATYDQAHRAYLEDRISAEQWIAYQVCWVLSAPRFSALGDGARVLVHRACEAARG